jgi:hypothetical protein
MKNKILKEAYRCLSSLLIACNEKKRSDVPDKDAIKTEIQAMEDVAAAYVTQGRDEILYYADDAISFLTKKSIRRQGGNS